jgi:hypothetical protein
METVMINEAVEVPSPGSVYGIFLCRLSVPVSLCYCVTSLASSNSGYGNIPSKAWNHYS